MVIHRGSQLRMVHGDLYYILWDQDIVKSIPMTDVASLERGIKVAKKRTTNTLRRGERYQFPTGMSWFQAMQNAVCGVGLDARISKMIAILYNEAKAEYESDNVVYKDYVAYGRA
mmetsp:Transcript_2967/g.6879  ORF Transcript_2967/g.6879 Transcript_2967/m.6879 type:complete len:115 (+) Transcript_2967:2231-2575(+)